jgi:hypothetical protein
MKMYHCAGLRCPYINGQSYCIAQLNDMATSTVPICLSHSFSSMGGCSKSLLSLNFSIFDNGM